MLPGCIAYPGNHAIYIYVGVGSIELINLHSSLKTPRHMYINIQKRHFSIPSIWLVARLKRKTMKKEKYLKCSEKLDQFDSLSGHNFVVLKCILQFAWLIQMYFHPFSFKDQIP